MLIFLFVKLVHWFSPRDIDFVSGSCRLLIFVPGIGCVLFFVMNLVARWFFTSWNSHIDFILLVKLGLLMELVGCWPFFRETYINVFLLVKLIFAYGSWLHAQFCSWKSLRADFFVRETFCKFVFLFVKLVHWFFSLWNWFCSWKFLRTDFCSWKLVACSFFSLWILYIDFSPRETDFVYGSFLRVDFLFVDLVAWWLLIEKPTVVGFSLRETCVLIFPPLELIFIYGTWRLLIFVRGTCCMLIFSWILLHVDFSLHKTLC